MRSYTNKEMAEEEWFEEQSDTPVGWNYEEEELAEAGRYNSEDSEEVRRDPKKKLYLQRKPKKKNTVRKAFGSKDTFSEE